MRDSGKGELFEVLGNRVKFDSYRVYSFKPCTSTQPHPPSLRLSFELVYTERNGRAQWQGQMRAGEQ